MTVGKAGGPTETPQVDQTPKVPGVSKKDLERSANFTLEQFGPDVSMAKVIEQFTSDVMRGLDKVGVRASARIIENPGEETQKQFILNNSSIPKTKSYFPFFTNPGEYPVKKVELNY